MKSVLLFGKKDARIVNLDIPKINNEEIRIKLLACGICGTDLEKYQGHFVTPPILGHEVVGIIDEVGKGIKDYKKDQRVFVHHHVPCRICYYCLRGDFTLCNNFTKVNFYPCGLSEYFKVPREIIIKKGIFVLNNSISNERATFIEPLACCIKAMNKINPKIGDKVVIFGAGPAGLLNLLLLKSLGIKEVSCVDINEKRLNFSKKIGAELSLKPDEKLEKEIKGWSNGIGCDIAIVATSNNKAILDSLKVVRKGGKICLFGNPKKEEILVSFSEIFIKEIKIIPSYSTTEFEIYQAISLLEKKLIKPEILISHKFKLEDSIKALETLEKGEAIKVIIYNYNFN